MAADDGRTEVARVAGVAAVSHHLSAGGHVELQLPDGLVDVVGVGGRRQTAHSPAAQTPYQVQGSSCAHMCPKLGCLEFDNKYLNDFFL